MLRVWHVTNILPVAKQHHVFCAVKYFSTKFITGEEYWLGLEEVYDLTHLGGYMLRIRMTDVNGEKAEVYYMDFAITDNV